MPAIHARRRLALTCLLPVLVTLAACTAPPQPAAGASGTTVPRPGITPAPTPTVDELITDEVPVDDAGTTVPHYQMGLGCS